MSPDESSQPRSRASRNSYIAIAVLALLPVLACFLGGGTQKWAEGFVVILLGGYLLVKPPRFSLGWVTNLVLVLLPLCAAIAFMPARWFLIPAWRTALVDDLGISIAQTVSPQ